MVGTRSLAGVLLVFGLLSASAGPARSERLVQSITEQRIVLHFNADEELVRKLLPAGWVSTPGTGLTKGTNVILALIESVAVSTADGKPTPQRVNLASMFIPARNEQTGVAGSMIVGGFVSQPEAAPGAYGTYVAGKFIVEKSSRTDESGTTMVEEDWTVSNEAGDKLRFTASYERGEGVRMHIEPRIYSTLRPEFYRIYKADQVAEIVHSTVTETKRARKVEFSSAGPQLSKLLDGKQQLIAVTSIPSYYRQIFLPE